MDEKTLKELAQALNNGAEGFDLSDLPTFGGTPIKDTRWVYSWDATSVLIYDADWRVVPRCPACGEADFNCGGHQNREDKAMDTTATATFQPTGPAYRSADVKHRFQSRWIENGIVGGSRAERHWFFDFKSATEVADDDLPWGDAKYITGIVVVDE